METVESLYDINELCSRIIIIDSGKILVEDTLEGIHTRYQKYKFVEIEYRDECTKQLHTKMIMALKKVEVHQELQSSSKQIYKIKIDDEETMNDLLYFITKNKDVINFQVYQESLESIVGNIIG